MLGIIKNSTHWRWVAAGKHPVAADYIQPAGASPLVEALSNWIAKGYQSLTLDDQSQGRHHSWRFWLSGGAGKNLVCGLICDSSDAIGRPFPFALIGEGRLKGWERGWPQLARELEKTWAALEYIAAHRYESSRDLVDALERINTPDCSLESSKCQVDRPTTGPKPADIDDNDGPLVFFIGRDQQEPVSQAVDIMQQRSVLQPRQLPNAVFLGGTLDKTCLALVQHPLRTADFIALWHL